MCIENTMDVPVALDEVRPALLDAERVAPCLPGASSDEDRGDGEYGGSMRIKLGPLTNTLKDTLRIPEADQTAHRAVIECRSPRHPGQGAASATTTSSLSPAEGGTHLNVVTDMKLAGTAAQFGCGVVADVSEKLSGQFAERLAEEIQNPAVSTTAAGVLNASDRPADPPRPGREPKALDLTATRRDAVLKRVAPVLAGVAGAALVIVALLRVSGRRSARRASYVVINGPLFAFGPDSHGPRRRRHR